MGLKEWQTVMRYENGKHMEAGKPQEGKETETKFFTQNSTRKHLCNDLKRVLLHLLKPEYTPLTFHFHYTWFK